MSELWEDGMSDELRAAVSKLRESIARGWFNWRKSHDPTDHMTGPVLDAYLAEHPADDGEPITEDWLRSVGFVLTDKGTGVKFFRLPPLAVRDDMDHWRIGMHRLNDGPKTRADVRRLCAALGIPCHAGK